ncbi:uncharacterized protein [Nerophis lumbriciformis]|uniref:uncharacterized protein n=1 Tax=Nerophis lumbriciformis TaxID=546530 RepID=UPI002ADF5D05|nr:uncharacterized protein LOC133574266 [Nerophis lumbriciformis]
MADSSHKLIIKDAPAKFKSKVWTHFGFYSVDGTKVDKNFTVCKMCLLQIPYTGGTTNMHSHLFRHHPDLAETTVPIPDLEIRSRSLRTPYGRVPWHPDRVNSLRQRRLRQKLDFLKPYIVGRQSDYDPEDKSDDHEEEGVELETEGSFEQGTGSISGSPRETHEMLQDPDEDGLLSGVSTSDPSYCPIPIDAASLSVDPQGDEGSPDVSNQSAAAIVPKEKVLQQFVNIMLADMRQIKNQMVLMKLRRDITDLVFKAMEEDMQRHVQVFLTQQGASAPPQSSFRPPLSRWQRALRRRNKGPGKHIGRICRSQAGPAPDDMNNTSVPQAVVQVPDIKLEIDPHMIKHEEEELPVL